MKIEKFAWKAVDQYGLVRRGIWTETGVSEIRKRLRSEGCFPVSIQKKEKHFRAGLLLLGNNHWSDFSRRLATLLEAGVPLLQSLEIMVSVGQRPAAQINEWKRIKDQIEEGRDLSEAMSASDTVPDAYVIALIRAGEQAGTLGKVLKEVADTLDQEAALQKKIKMALAYPVLLFFAVFVVLYVMSVWVLPMYEQMFSNLDRNAELPVISQVVFVCGRNLPRFLWGAAGLAAGFLALKLTQPELGHKYWRLLLEKLPLLGKISYLRDQVQFSGLLGRLVTAGIPLLEALQLTASVPRSAHLRDLSSQLIHHVRQGRRMAPLLRASPVFLKEAAEMIAIAEETGQLEQILLYVTALLQRELEDRLNRLTRILEPALIFAAAGLIGLIAAGMMLPIFDLSTQLY